MKNCSLVTGGAGFIGSHVATHLLQKGDQVIILDDLSGGKLENIPQGAIFHEGSICDTLLVNTLFERYKFDYVYHLAAYAAEGLSHFIRHYNYQNNLIGSINLINASVNNKVKCFVFTSSIAVYGTNELPLRETQYPRPEDPYGIAKYAVELDLKNAHELFGLDYVIFRPHNVYGPQQHIGDKYRNVIGIFMNQLLQNQPLTIFGDGNQTRAFSDIDDVAPYIAEAPYIPKARQQIFNIGNDKAHCVNDLAIAVGKAMDMPPKINYLKQREEVLHAYASHSKFYKIFEPKTTTSLADGLLKMATWAKTQGAQESSKFSSLEITKNLPPTWR